MTTSPLATGARNAAGGVRAGLILGVAAASFILADLVDTLLRPGYASSDTG